MPRHMAAPDGSGLPGFYRHLSKGLSDLGAKVEIRHRDVDDLASTPPRPDFGFVHNGRIARQGILNTGLAYIAPFWYVDKAGIFADSSIAAALFDPGTVAPQPAERFYSRLSARLCGSRESRYPQKAEHTDIPAGSIAVFLQDLSDPVERARYMTAREMLQSVLAHTNGRPVIVKPHPRNMGEETAQLQDWLARAHPDVIVSDANLHDILASAAVSVSISSAVSMEGMLHRVPAVLFGRSDFHHCAETVRRAQDWPAALDRALNRDWPFDRFLFWFLREHCIAAGSKRMMPTVLNRMREAGADMTELGVGGQP